MKYRSMITIGLAIFIIACIALIGTGVIFLTRIPAVETQVPLGSTPVHVQLSAPVSPTGWPLNSYIPIQAEAMGGGTISTIELYINGVLYQKVSSPAGWDQPEYFGRWRWQPGTTGIFILLAKATNTMGATGISNPIRLDVIDAAGTRSPYVVKEGETLGSIAGTEQLDLSDLSNANPSIEDPNQVIPVDTQIDLPNPPAPVTNPNIISGFPELEIADQPPVDTSAPAEPGSEEGNPPPPDEEKPQGLIIASFQDLKFWLDQKKPEDSVSLPLEPIISAIVNNKCDVTLHLGNSHFYNDSNDPAADNSKNESGFFINRSQDGKPFERIATLPAIIYNNSWEYYNGYKLPEQFGLVTFTISAFNTAGETTSAPVTLPLDEADCAAKSRGLEALGQIRLEDRNLILPYSMDLAYFYISINNARSYRVPEGDRMFLPDSGMKLNLDDYFDTLLGSFTAADFDISMEVWGWIGPDLKLVGTFKTTIHRSVLLVCSEEGEGKCSGNGDGEWLTEINFSDQKPVKDQIYMFKWISSQRQKSDRVCYQYSASPYRDESMFNINEPIESQCGSIIINGQYVKSNEEKFPVSMGQLLYPTEQPEYLGWGNNEEINDYHSVWFQEDYPEGSSFTIYTRVKPMAQKYDGLARFSNTVLMHRNTLPVPSELPPLASTLPSLYDIQILRESYVPPEFEVWDDWGCVIIDEDPTGEFTPGETVCPGKIPPKDECEGKSDLICFFESIPGALDFLLDQFSWAFELWKSAIAQNISNIIPGCSDADWCRSAVKKGVDYGLSYLTGLPPTIPTSDQLIADNVGEMFVNAAGVAEMYFTGYDKSAVKIFCDQVDCQKVVSDKFLSEYKQAKSFVANKSCSGGMEAYYHGQTPNCLDPSIIMHAAPGSGNYPAVIAVKITRKAASETDLVQAFFSPYRLAINVNATSDLSKLGYSQTEWKEYESVLLEIPDIPPGKSTTLFIPLEPCSVGDQNGGTCGQFEDYEGMKPIYYNGVTKMKAFEACYSTGSSWEWVPCTEGGQDYWEFANPMSIDFFGN
jgi:hypothetical protein